MKLKNLLKHCITLIKYDEQRKFEIENEHIKIQQEICKINEISKETNKMLSFNRYTKNINGQDQQQQRKKLTQGF